MVLLKAKNRGKLLFVLSFAAGIAVSFNNCSKIKVADMPEALASKMNTGAMIFINNNDEFTNNKNVSLQISADGANEMYVTNDPSCQAGGQWEPYGSSKAWVLGQENGTTSVFVKFKEPTQHLESICFDDSIVHDNVPPVLVLTSPAPDVTNQTSFNIGFTASDAVSGVAQLDCRDGSGKLISGCSESLKLSALTEGPGSVRITARDKAGNISMPLVQTYVVDLTPPVVNITSTPSAITNQMTSAFTFTGTDNFSFGISFECKVDSGVFQSCTSPYSTTLTAGAHQFSVRAKDKAGNTSSPASYSWTIDTQAPTVQITSGPSNYEKTGSASFTFVGLNKPISKFECQLDSKGYSACTSPVNYSNLTEGTHLFEVRGYDSAGNMSSPAQRSWIIDMTKPLVQITLHPNGVNRDTSALFVWTASDSLSGIASTECSLDNGTYSPCQATINYQNLTEGSHHFAVRAKDNAGNDSLPAEYTWTIDLTKPVLKFISTPLALTKDVNATFVMTVTDNIAGSNNIIQCRLDNNLTYDVCSTTQVFSALADGAHTFYAHALDSVGNMSDELTYSWSIDSMGPNITFSKIPLQKIGTIDTATLAFTITDAVSGVDTYSCDLNGTPRVCDVVYTETFANLSAGNYVYTVKAKDKLGNASTNSVAWTVVNSTRLVSQDVTVNSNKKVDILVVIDNSGSMQYEQKNMADRFNSFLTTLSGLDWQLAIVTTDLDNDAPLKDGRFVEFSGLPGSYIITSSMNPTTASTAFAGTIQRPEKGSGSEQGIGASYRAIQRSQSPTVTVNAPNAAFFRTGAALSVLVVTDADETPINGTKIFNKPQELLNLVQTTFPNKPFLFHSIIVKSGDTVCKAGSSANLNEDYGLSYEQISALTGGIVGSVCEANYTNQLTAMGNAVVDLVKSVTLQCAPLDTNGDGIPDISIVLAGGGTPPTYTLSGQKLTFSTLLPAGQNKIQYTCLQ